MAIPPVAAVAQAAGSPSHVTVRGIAFDSVRGRPIPNAFVAIVGGRASTTTDTGGRFSFDSVPPGTYTFAVQHSTLDSLGFSGLSARVNVSAPGDEVRIAVPSFTTLWRAACGSTVPQIDTGFVYGLVRDGTTHRAVANGEVHVTWTDMIMDERRGFTTRTWRLNGHTDSLGNYAVCNVPTAAANLRVRAMSDSAFTGDIEFTAADARVVRRDLTLGPRAGPEGGKRGTVAGILTDNFSDPFFNARVLINGVGEVRTGADGRFLLRDVPTGSRQVEFRSIGMLPVVSVVDVVANDTAFVVMQLGRVTTLEAMRVERERRGRSLALDFESRRKLGVGYSFDTTAILTYNDFRSLFSNVSGLHAEFRGANMLLSMSNGRGGNCRPVVRLDGVVASFENLVDLFPSEVAGVEVFPRAAHIPTGYTPLLSEPPCGLIMVWTRYGFRER